MADRNPFPAQGQHGVVRYGGALAPAEGAKDLVEASFRSRMWIVAVDHGDLIVRWERPAGTTWDSIALVRNFAGPPIDIADGTLMGTWSRDAGMASVRDATVALGLHVSYGLFVHLTAEEIWVRCGYTTAVAPADWGWEQRVTDWVPWFHHVMDQRTYPNDRPLQRFLRLFALELDQTQSDITSLLHNNDPSRCAPSNLPALCHELGLRYRSALGDGRMRVLAKAYTTLPGMRGSKEGLRRFVEALSGYPTEVTVGNNLMPSADDAEFRTSIGSWLVYPPNDGEESSASPGSRSTMPDGGTGNYLRIDIDNDLQGPLCRTDLIQIESGGEFRDTFADDAGSPWLGASWDPVDGQIGVIGKSGGTAHVDVAGNCLYAFNTGFGRFDGYLEFVLGSAFDEGDGVVLRCSDYTNFIYVRKTAVADEWELGERLAGVDTPIDTFTAANSAGTTIQINYQDDDYEISVDGYEVLSTTAAFGGSSGSATLVGLLAEAASSTSEWDSFTHVPAGLVTGGTSAEYTFSAYMRTITGTPGFSSSIQFWDENLALLSTVESTPGVYYSPSSVDWESRLSLTATPPAGARWAEWVILHSASSSGSVVGIDDVMLERSGSAGEYESPRKVHIWCAPNRINWVNNPTLDTNDDYWTESWITQAHNALDGFIGTVTSSLQLTTTAGGGHTDTNTAPTTAGETWTFSAYVKAVGGDASAVPELVMESDGGDVLVLSAESADLYSGTATSGGASTLTDSGATWTVDEWAGKSVRIVGGTGVHQVRTVDSNTATALTVDVAWDVTPDATSLYLIEEPTPPYELPEEQWVRIHVTGQVPSGTNWHDFGAIPDITTVLGRVRLPAQTAGTDILVDGALLERSAVLGEFFDADTATPYSEYQAATSPGSSPTMYHMHRSIRNYALTQDVPHWVPADLDWDLNYVLELP